MKAYILAPGQTLFGSSGVLPRTPLTAIGRVTAAKAGERLAEEGFAGEILCAPTRRAMETALAVAEKCGGKPLCEELLEAEEGALRAFLATLADRGGDVLLVGDGPLPSAAKKQWNMEHWRSITPWFASLSYWNSETEESYLWDVSHLPKEVRFSPKTNWKDVERVAGETITAASTFFAESFGARVLHLGDTYTFQYEFYRRLIAATRPDVVIHTGDLADEWKAGRLLADRGPWREHASRLLQIFKDSAAEVILVPGNNDLLDYLEENATFAQVVAPTTVWEREGKRVCLAHSLGELGAEADVYLYGHGLGGERRTPEDNEEGGRLYFNSCWGITLHDFGAGRHLIAPIPGY